MASKNIINYLSISKINGVGLQVVDEVRWDNEDDDTRPVVVKIPGANMETVIAVLTTTDIEVLRAGKVCDSACDSKRSHKAINERPVI